MQGHIIVCGGDALAVRIAEELTHAGMTVVTLRSADELMAAGVTEAESIVCVDDDDAVNLEVALLARQANPTTRVVARVANTVIRQAMAENNGPGAILDVADLAAPSVVEACLTRTTHTILGVDGIEFVVSGTEASRDATLRELYGDLAPVAVIGGENSDTPGAVTTCPGRDLEVRRGDWTAMIGTLDELAAQHIDVPTALPSTHVHRNVFVRMLDSVRAFRDDVNPTFYRALAAAGALLLGSSVILRFTYQHPGMDWIDALYFSTETIATVGYGDFNFLEQPTWLRLWGIVMMFAGLFTTAIVIAFIADVLLSRRLGRSTSRHKIGHLRRHFVIVGLGSFGVRVASMLKAAGHDVAVVELNEENRYLAAIAEQRIPVIFGDATLRQTLESAHVRAARAVAVMTDDDMVNIETGIVLREVLGSAEDVPIVMRVFDRALGDAVGQRFGFDLVRSTVDLATPWFIGAAMGLQVLSTFSVGQHSFMVGVARVDAGSELDGVTTADLPLETRVIGITRDHGRPTLYPSRDVLITAGDSVYLVGPYREALGTLRMGQGAGRPGSSRPATSG
ncbi:NAD-binding protein [Mycobacterium sp. B14F4]|uniref:NAD-binding protein n=1 Tax=Mycobacterium sp. B14F4 TaxID=3153565 RepID=UPI00325E0F23